MQGGGAADLVCCLVRIPEDVGLGLSERTRCAHYP